MTLKKNFFITLVLLVTINSVSISQVTIPKGKSQLVEFNNETANFTVPEGKTWIIYNIFSDYIVGGKLQYNDRKERNELKDTKAVRIYLKKLNGNELTNKQKNIFGTQMYRSDGFSNGNIQYPIIFPEKTTFSLVVFKGYGLGSLELHNSLSYISFIETDN